MTFDLLAWGWPQWTVAITYGVTLLLCAAFNGQPREGKHNFALSLMMVAIWVVILGFGGFWS